MNELITILIVEDEPLTRDAVSHIIRDNFADGDILFVSAANGVEALEKLSQFPSDILLTDISMPEMDGIELVRQVDQQYPNIVKIVLSGYDDFQYAQNSIRFHVMEYLLKPVDNQELVQTIAKAIRKVQETKERNRASGLMDMHQSGKLSFLYSTNIIQEAMLAIKTRNEAAIHSTVDKIAFYLESRSDSLEEKLKMADWICDILSFYQPEVLSEAVIRDYQKKLYKCSQPGEIYILLEELFLSCTNVLREESRSIHKLEQIKEYISNNYAKEIYLQKLSDIFNLNQTYICDLFKNYSGQTYMDYLQEVRINRALYLLENTEYKIVRIAEETGYRDANYFTKIFKKVIGMTPNEYRAKMK